MFGAEYVRQVSPRVMMLSELLASHGGALGARAGSRFEWNGGDLEATAYRFDERFPFLDPLYRPGETGVDLSGWLRPSEFTSLSGHVTYVAHGPLRGGSEVRADLWLGWYLGDNRPHLRLGYARSEITLDRTSIADRGVVSDRLVLSLSKSGARGLLNVDLEHLWDSGSEGRGRSQVVTAFHRSWAPSTLATGMAIVQRDAAGNLGLTGDGAVERAWRGPYRYLVGLGAALVERGGSESGDGVLRLGLARRLSTDGWVGRLEVRIPFGVGLPRAGLVSRQLVAELGQRLSWHDWRSLGDSGLLSFGAAPRTGQVEGRVTAGGRGIAGVEVSVDGEPRAVTDRQGRFRLRRLPAGPVSLAIDPRQLETRWSVAGGSQRLISVPAGGVVRLELELRESSSLRGSVVACGAGDDPARLSGLAGAIVRLTGEGAERSTTTSRLGGFQFDDLPPASYELSVLDPGSAEGEPLARVALDLEQSRTGLVVRIGCGDG